MGSKMIDFESRSVTTMMFVHPLLSGSSTIKSIDSACHARSGISSGFSSPLFYSLQYFVRPHTS